MTISISTWRRDRRVAIGRHGEGWQREVGVLAVAAGVYFGGRVLVEGSPTESTENAQTLIDLERSLGIDIEQGVQRLALEHDWLRVLGNLSYVWLHWPLLLFVLGFLFFRDRHRYRRLRNAIFVSGLCGMVLFTLVPMSPPRFMPGFVGTVSDDARRHYIQYPLSWTNRFAAFPSFHVGWTLIACLALAACLRSPVATTRWVGAHPYHLLALVPAVMVALAVISTGNHYVIDSVVGGLIAVGAYLLSGRRTRSSSADRTAD